MQKIIKFYNLLKVPALVSDNTTVANIFAHFILKHLPKSRFFSLSFAFQHNFQI